MVNECDHRISSAALSPVQISNTNPWTIIMQQQQCITIKHGNKLLLLYTSNNMGKLSKLICFQRKIFNIMGSNIWAIPFKLYNKEANGNQNSSNILYKFS